MKNIILASTSPRRQALLAQLGLEFKVDGRVREDPKISGLEPSELVKKLSLEKALLIVKYHTDAIIISADTIGIVSGRVIGKPHSYDDARTVLSLLSGKAHTVITGFTVIDTGTKKTVTQSVATTVYFKKLTAEEINAYIATGEPMDKAGAYAIQGLGAALVERIEGDYYNVVGLPLYALAEVLKQFGVNVLQK